MLDWRPPLTLMAGAVELQSWLDRARSGDAAAFERIIAHFERMLYAVARHTTSCENDALDGCQDAVLRAWQGIARFDGDAAVVGPWLARIVRNCCIDRTRRAQRVQSHAQRGLAAADGVAHLLDPNRSPEELAAAGEVAAAVEQAIARLPADQRVTLTLMRAGFAYAEIAETLGIAEGTVKSRIARARVALRALLTGEPTMEPLSGRQRSRSNK